ncbi:MAG: hypothetical protein AAF725_21290, partial [Acidobacteriota bacterium]
PRQKGARALLAALAACWCLASPGTAPALAGASGAAASGEDSGTGDPWIASLGAAVSARHIGPLGNRVSAVVGVAGDPNTYFAGAASGGVFKSSDGGHSWRPTFDDTPAFSIGSLAVSPSDPNVVWASTGEPFIRSNVSMGDGIYRSTDGGESWENRGLPLSGRIGRLAVHPEDPQVVWAAALGHGYGPSPERGVYKTVDGGESWRRVLHVDEKTGAADVVIDPHNPRVLFAGLWQFEMNGFGRTSGGPGSSLWRSVDGGETWKQLQGRGLPVPPWGKIGLGVSAADSSRVYALIETNSNREFIGESGLKVPSDPYAGTLWRSDDGGDSWRMVNADNSLHQRPLYYTRLLPSPQDADEVHFMSVSHGLSKDGGVTTESVPSGYDHHDMWIDPQNPSRWIVGHDGGVSLSSDGGRSWFRPQLPIAQMYRVAVDDEVPYRVYGNRQDGAAMRGPSQTLAAGGIPLGAWRSVGGCEVGWSLPDPRDSEIVWSTCYDGILERYDARTGQVRDVSVWPEAIESWPASELKYRFTWSFPIVFSPHAEGRLYAGSHVLHATDDEGQTWRRLSDDLTSGDPELMRRTGGLTLDDAGPTVGPSLYAIAESPLEPGRLWTGSNDGRVHTSPDGGVTWIDVSAGLEGAPALGTVTSLEPSRHRPEVVYLSIDGHRQGDFAAHVFRSEDRGASWRRISDGLDQGVFSYVHRIAEDPVRPGLLYAGTEGGLFLSFDDGRSWRRFDNGLPPVPVYWITFQQDFADLVLATYGRGFWVIDDITPLRQLGDHHLRPGADAAEPTLFAPRPTFRLRARPPAMSQPGDPAAGSNPESGAPLSYWLPAGVTKAAVEILDAAGETVRTLEGGVAPGFHRLWWDLYGEASHEPRLRTRPQERPDQALPPEGWRPLTDGGPVRVMALPGTYSVRLTVSRQPEEAEGDEAAPTALASLEQPLELRPDPDGAATLRGLEARHRTLLDLRQLAERSARLIDEIEWLRKDLEAFEKRLESLPGSRRGRRETLEAARSATAALEGLEGRFFDLRLSGARQDSLRWRRLLWARIGYLAGRVARSDAPPTASQLEVAALLAQRVEAAGARYEEIVSGELAELAKLQEEHGLNSVVIGSSRVDAAAE